jgi:hypothetical protein
MPSRSEPTDVADLSDHDGGDHRPHSGDLLDGVIPDVIGEDMGDRVVGARRGIDVAFQGGVSV